jgi:hypothetical protein
VGVEGRGPFYEKAGALRDILQNHAMEVLALIAMEPPESFQAEAVRSEKLKVWHSIAAIPLEHAIRGQYGPGKIDGKKVVGYRQEDRVQPESGTETFAEVRLEIANIDVMISSQYSPPLANAILKENVHAAFLRREKGVPELAFRPLVKEPLVVVLPSDHRLAARKAISPGALVGETFVGVSHTAPVLRAVIDDYLKRSGINITPDHETEHVVMGVSLIASTGGVGLLPAYAQNFLTRSVMSRPLNGDTPTVELVLGYKKSNESPILI